MELIRDISPLDDMFQGSLEHYFHVGESALQCIYTVMSSAGKSHRDIRSILDFPCGFGRVLRHLKVAFPEAVITACDLETAGVDYCAKTFGARPAYSNKDPRHIEVPETFDLIWVGSLLTHLDIKDWGHFVNLFSSLLNPGGLLVITLHGHQVLQNINSGHNIYGLGAKDLSILTKEYVQNQFGYVNYPYFDGYGISISSPLNSLKFFRKYTNLKVVSYQEKAWDDHQDVVCCQKEAVKAEIDVVETTLVSNPQQFSRNITAGDKPGVIFCLPEGLTLGGVTTWSVELSRGLKDAGFTTFLGIHPSRYNNPPLDFGITEEDHLIDCMRLPHPDDPNLHAEDYLPLYEKALPGVLIPSWSWGTYAMASLFASTQPKNLRVIGMAHSDESGYYQWLVHYEAMIHKFLVANAEIKRRLSIFLPHRADDILIKPAPVHVPDEIIRTYSPPEKPLQLVYGGRIAQYQKRVFDLIDLVKALVKEEVNFHFRIIGGGADKDEFCRKVNQLPEKIQTLISLEDSLPLSQLPDLWRSTDINVMVSDFEGVSNSMLMGMAEGCVPVMTAVSGTVEVITSGLDGYLTPVGDMTKMAQVIKTLDDDRGLLAKAGQNAHKTVRAKYSQKEYNSWFTKIIQQVWAESARPWPPVHPPVAFQSIHREFEKFNNQAISHLSLAGQSRKSKILFLSHDANWGGAPKVMHSLVKGLDKTRWLPLVVLPGHGDLENEYAKIGVDTVISPMKFITTDPALYWQQYSNFSRDLRERVNKIIEIIQREQIDIVISNTVCIFEGALAAKSVGKPHIWYIHELASQDDQLTPLFDFPTFYATMDFLSDKLVVISKAVQQEVNQIFPSKKFAQIYTGLEDNETKPVDDREKVLGISPEVPVITFLGVISKRKGVFILVDVAGMLVERFPHVKFAIAGKKEGETYKQLQMAINDRGLKDQFHFLGFRHDISEIISCSDIVIIPSQIEPFSLVALEAMRGSKPVIATKSGGPEEIVIDGETGILVPVNNAVDMAKAVAGLLDNPELMKAMGQKGHQRFVDHFRYDRYINQFEKLLVEVVSTYKAPNFANRLAVENIYNLSNVAARAKADIASLSKSGNPNSVVEELLSISSEGDRPFRVAAVPEGKERPKVSICVPVYNGAEYLRECIDSILSQKFTDFEFVLVNDASTDSTEEIIQSYSDARIRYFKNPKNLGLVDNWNKCLECSTGEYVCIFHQDDLMTPVNIGEKVAVLDFDKGIGLVFSDTFIINQKREIRSNRWFNPIEPNVDFIWPGKSFFDLMYVNLNLVCCPSVVVRRKCYEVIGGFDNRLPFSCDMEMWMRIALFYDVAYISRPLMKYRFHDSNETNKHLDLDLIHIYLSKKFLVDKHPELLGNTYKNKLIADTTQRVFDRATHHFHMHQPKIARQYLYFLEKIRGNAAEPELMDVYIRQLHTYVNQASAIELLLRRENSRTQGNRNLAKPDREKSALSKLILRWGDALKPYLPPVIKKPLKKLRDKLAR